MNDTKPRCPICDSTMHRCSSGDCVHCSNITCAGTMRPRYRNGDFAGWRKV